MPGSTFRCRDAYREMDGDGNKKKRGWRTERGVGGGEQEERKQALEEDPEGGEGAWGKGAEKHKINQAL